MSAPGSFRMATLGSPITWYATGSELLRAAREILPGTSRTQRGNLPLRQEAGAPRTVVANLPLPWGRHISRGPVGRRGCSFFSAQRPS
eukprot:scaffold3300_cov239-Pinguiococcus_pyrenoidosus.AAC.7